MYLSLIVRVSVKPAVLSAVRRVGIEVAAVITISPAISKALHHF